MYQCDIFIFGDVAPFCFSSNSPFIPWTIYSSCSQKIELTQKYYPTKVWWGIMIGTKFDGHGLSGFIDFDLFALLKAFDSGID